MISAKGEWEVSLSENPPAVGEKKFATVAYVNQLEADCKKLQSERDRLRLSLWELVWRVDEQPTKNLSDSLLSAFENAKQLLEEIKL